MDFQISGDISLHNSPNAAIQNRESAKKCQIDDWQAVWQFYPVKHDRKDTQVRFARDSVPEEVWRIASVLSDFEFYPIGGIIRDSILHAWSLGKTDVSQAARGDWDFATSALPEVVAERMERVGFLALDVGIKHGTVVAVKEGRQYEITTFRKDVTTDGRHAEVSFGCSLDEDVQRRDFTINTLALNLQSLQVIDLCRGLDDLQAGIIRAVGEPEIRFREDHLRLLRAVRMATLLNFQIHEKTWNALVACAPMIDQVSSERIRDEIMKMLATAKPSTGVRMLQRSGLLAVIMPELDRCFGVAQNQYHSHDVGEHTLLSVDAISPRFPLLRMIHLLHDIGKPSARAYFPDRDDYVFYGHEKIGAEMAVEVLKRLRFSNKEIEQAQILIAEHMFKLTDPCLGKRGLRRFLRRLGRENLDAYLRLRIADRIGNEKWQGTWEPGLREAIRSLREIFRDEDALHVTDLAINGDDLIALGLKPSPLFSRILNNLLEKVLDEPSLNNRHDLLCLVQQCIQEEKSSKN